MRNMLLDKYIERLLNDSSPEAPVWNLESIRQARKPHWNYVDGCMMTALLSLYEISGDKKFFLFTDSFLDYYIAEDGIPLGYELEDYNLDNINGGRALLEVYAATGREKYKRAVDLLLRQLGSQPRTQEGSYWHKQIYPNQVWLDGLYMAQVFRAMYAVRLDGDGETADIYRQFFTVRRRMYVPEKRLYCHGYDESRSIFWADGESGRSKGFWLRAMGWYAAAMADVLGYVPDSSQKERLTEQFCEMLDGICSYRDTSSDMFYQVADQGGREGNYPETSGSAMVAYALLKGARLGLLPSGAREEGRRVFDGICRRYLSEINGKLSLDGICLVAGLGPENDPRRDGSYEYYISEPVVQNDAKGVGPFILCYTEILRL